MTATRDLTEMSPREIDELWAEAEATLEPLRSQWAETIRSIGKYQRAGWPEHKYNWLIVRRNELDAVLKVAEEILAPFRAEWERRADLNGTRRGWTRYHQCTSDGGHIHNLPCHTLTPFKSKVVIRPELTGLSVADMVAQVGYAACSHCFPEAPTHEAWKQGEAAAAAAEADKAAKRCPGSSKYATGAGRRRSAKCPECRTTVAVTPTGLLRAHEKPKVAGA